MWGGGHVHTNIVTMSNPMAGVCAQMMSTMTDKA